MLHLLRRGLWLAILRVHQGLPGPIGEIRDGQFIGGLAGVRTAWPLQPNPTLGLLDAVPIAGIYSFGVLWPKVFQAMELPNDFKDLLSRLEADLGRPSDEELQCAPIHPETLRPVAE